MCIRDSPTLINDQQHVNSVPATAPKRKTEGPVQMHEQTNYARGASFFDASMTPPSAWGCPSLENWRAGITHRGDAFYD
eukprot:3488429-Lingulodinium_polyedra.AAC.1